MHQAMTKVFVERFSLAEIEAEQRQLEQAGIAPRRN
jgi:hypothetical protein